MKLVVGAGIVVVAAGAIYYASRQSGSKGGGNIGVSRDVPVNARPAPPHKKAVQRPANQQELKKATLEKEKQPPITDVVKPGPPALGAPARIESRPKEPIVSRPASLIQNLPIIFKQLPETVRPSSKLRAPSRRQRVSSRKPISNTVSKVFGRLRRR